MFEAIVLKVLTAKVLPLVIPPVIAVARRVVLDRMPKSLMPLALAVGGGLVGGIASAMGVDVPDLSSLTGDAAVGAWQGALVSLAAAGVYDVWKHTKAWWAERKAKR